MPDNIQYFQRPDGTVYGVNAPPGGKITPEMAEHAFSKYSAAKNVATAAAGLGLPGRPPMSQGVGPAVPQLQARQDAQAAADANSYGSGSMDPATILQQIRNRTFGSSGPYAPVT